MAHGGQDLPDVEDTKASQIQDQDKQEKLLKQMIDYINTHTDYAVVTKTEQSMIKASTPVRPKQGLFNEAFPPRPPSPTPQRADQPSIYQLPYGSRPNIPPFSGENKAGEVTFDVWKYDVKCLIREETYPQSTIRQSIRNSLRGKARSILVTMGEDATPASIVRKLESVFGNVCDKEALLESFYKQSQNQDESVAEYGMRLENLLQIPVERGQISIPERNNMLCSKFFSGLKDPMLQTAIRFKYEAIRDFEVLLREARTVEQQLQSSRDTKPQQQEARATVKQQTASRISNDEIAKQLETLTMQMNELQAEMKTVRSGNQGTIKDQRPEQNQQGGYYQSRNYRGNRFGYRGDNGNRGRGYSGYRFNHPLNGKKSPSRGTQW